MPQVPLPDPGPPPYPAAAGAVLHAILHPEPQAGPPYTHTFASPEPAGTELWEQVEAPLRDRAARVTAWIRERIEEDRAAAAACTSRDWVAHGATVRGGPWVETAEHGPLMSQFVGRPFPDHIGSMLPPTGPHDADFWTMVNLHGTTGKFESEMRNATYIARHDPARTLRQCDALTDALTEMEKLAERAEHPDARAGAREVIMSLAGIWADGDEISAIYLGQEPGQHENSQEQP